MGAPADAFTARWFEKIPKFEHGKQVASTNRKCLSCGAKVSIQASRCNHHAWTCSDLRAKLREAVGERGHIERVDFLNMAVRIGVAESQEAAANLLAGPFLVSFQREEAARTSSNGEGSSPWESPPPRKRSRAQEALAKSASGSRSIAQWATPLAPAQKAKLDKLYANMVVLEFGSFDPFKGEAALAFLAALHPQYAEVGVPSAEAVRSTHLDRLVGTVMGPVLEEMVRYRSVGVTTDGWTDASGDGLHNVMVCFPTPFLVGAERFDGGEEKKPQLVQLVETIVDRHVISVFKDRDRPAPVLVGLCTDSPSTNKGVRAVLEEDKERGLVPYGCVCHALNNLGKWAYKLGEIPKVVKEAMAVAKVFRNVKAAKAALREVVKASGESVAKPVLPVETRWNSNQHAIESVLRNRNALVHVAASAKQGLLKHNVDLTQEFGGDRAQGQGGRSVDQIINDPVFWERLRLLAQLFRPLADLVTYLEGDEVPISMVPAAFIKLLRVFEAVSNLTDDEFVYTELGLAKTHFVLEKGDDAHKRTTLPNKLLTYWHTITSHRVNAATPGKASGVMQLALVLDRGTRALALEAARARIQLDQGRSVLDAALEGARFVGGRLATTNGAGPVRAVEMAHEFFLDIRMLSSEALGNAPLGVRPWAREVGEAQQVVRSEFIDHPFQHYMTEATLRADLARAIFTLPSSAAGGERCFSTYGRVHTKARNRMGQKTLDKVVQVRLNRGQMARARSYLVAQRQWDTWEFFYSVDHTVRFRAAQADQGEPTEDEDEDERTDDESTEEAQEQQE